MKKRLLSLALCFCMAVGVLVGCGGSNTGNTEANSNSSNEETSKQPSEGTSELPSEDSTEDSGKVDTEENTTDKEDAEAKKKEQCLNEAVNAYKNYIASHNPNEFSSINLVYLGNEYYPALVDYGYGSNFCTLYVYSPTLGVINVNKPNSSRLISGCSVYYNSTTNIFRLNENEGSSDLYGKYTEEGLEILCVKDGDEPYDIITFDKNYFEAEKKTGLSKAEVDAYISAFGNDDDFIKIKDSFSNIDEAAQYLLTGKESDETMLRGIEDAYGDYIDDNFDYDRISSIVSFKTPNLEYPCLLALLKDGDKVNMIYSYISAKESVGHYIADGKVLVESCNYEVVHVFEDGTICIMYREDRGNYKAEVKEIYSVECSSDNIDLKLVTKYERIYFERDGEYVTSEYKLDGVTVTEDEQAEWLKKYLTNGSVSYVSIEGALGDVIKFK